VFTDTHPHRLVLLCGDWNGWEPIEMLVEQGKRLFYCLHALRLTPSHTLLP
jgi:hypothetical protein